MAGQQKKLKARQAYLPNMSARTGLLAENEKMENPLSAPTPAEASFSNGVSTFSVFSGGSSGGCTLSRFETKSSRRRDRVVAVSPFAASSNVLVFFSISRRIDPSFSKLNRLTKSVR